MQHIRAHVLVCGGTGCKANGSKEIQLTFARELQKFGLQDEVMVVETGCHGFCEHGPLVIVYPEGTFYCGVKPEDVKTIVEEHLYKGRIVQRLLYREPINQEQVPRYSEIGFYKKQHRLVLANCGAINPEAIEEYIAVGGYEALAKAITQMTPQEVVDEVKKSGLRGRGGGGFPTGMKWQFAKNSESDKKYVICNADEGDPGAFMDRSVLEGDPHRVLEGMAICGYAMGADEGYIYVRAEYPLAIKRLRTAIAQAEEMGLLGEHIFESDFSFTIHIMILPVKAKTLVPFDFSVPSWQYQSAPLTIICATLAKVSTLLMLVGLPHRPLTAGKGGRGRGIPRLPSIEAIRAVSSPQTKAPAPSLI